MQFKSPSAFLRLSKAEQDAYIEQLTHRARRAYYELLREHVIAEREQLKRDLAAMNAERKPGEPPFELTGLDLDEELPSHSSPT